MKYDYLIVGCGLFGVVFAREMTNAGKKCLIIDKRNHIGGNVYTESKEGINVHVYGPHIFHTSDKGIWDYVNKYATFNNFRYEPIAKFKDEVYNLPFNMNTFSKMWGVATPQEAISKINSQIIEINNPKNLEEFALSKVGRDIYDKLIKGYTTKQWGTDPKNLPISIIKRIPLRFTYDNNYYYDTYQGIPIGGYTKMIQNMIGDDIEVILNIDYLENREYYDSIATNIVYTGKIDEFFDYRFGELEYRSLKFETEVLENGDFQGVAGVNYTDIETPWTRIIEHKHFEMLNTKNTVITREYPQKFKKNNIPYYPINDDKNNKIYQKYKELSLSYSNVIFGGRLAEYKYYDMHQIIGSALSKTKRILN
jgi:UDP-galactopyranose mutase